MRRSRSSTDKKHILKITRTEQNRQLITDRTRTIALIPGEVFATVHLLQIAMVSKVTVTLDLFGLKQDLTRLIRCITHSSHAIVCTNQVSENRT